VRPPAWSRLADSESRVARRAIVGFTDAKRALCDGSLPLSGTRLLVWLGTSPPLCGMSQFRRQTVNNICCFYHTRSPKPTLPPPPGPGPGAAGG
jgi:hypothetical protein